MKITDLEIGTVFCISNSNWIWQVKEKNEKENCIKAVSENGDERIFKDCVGLEILGHIPEVEKE